VKVIAVIDGLWIGGSERSLAEVLPHLRRAGIEPIVVVLRRCQEGVEREVLAEGFDVRPLPQGGWLARISALRRMIRAERPALIHTSLWKANQTARLAAVGLGVPVLTSLVNIPHDPARRAAESHLKTWRVALVRAFDRFTSRFLTDHFHAVSRAARDAAISNLGVKTTRITVVERGRDLGRLGRPSPERRRRAREALGLADDVEAVINVGRIEPTKGQRFLLEAIAELRARRPRLELLIAGRPGLASAELDDLRASLGLDDAVHFLGHRDDVPELLAAADIFVLPSISEGFPGVVLEAMALGLPVVASALPSVHEIVEPEASARWVEPGSARELARVIGDLLDDPELRQRFGERGRQIFEERFTLEKSARRMVELYRRLARRELMGDAL